MKNKIISIFVCIVLIISGIVFIYKEINIRAEIGGGEGSENGIGLNYTFMWDNITKKLCNVTHIYPDGMIPKGRAFATWGDKYTAEWILKEEMNNIGLENVDKVIVFVMTNGRDHFARHRLAAAPLD